MERLWADRLTTPVEQLAHHTVRGELWEKALVYCRQAGIKATMRSAHREAMGCFEHALIALQHLPEQRLRGSRPSIFASTSAMRSCHSENRRISSTTCERRKRSRGLARSPRLGQAFVYLAEYFPIMRDLGPCRRVRSTRAHARHHPWGCRASGPGEFLSRLSLLCPG